MTWVAAQLIEHRATLPIVAAVRIVRRVDEVQIADVRLDRNPVVVGLQDRLVAAPGRRAVPSNEQGLGHSDIDALEEGEQQRSAP